MNQLIHINTRLNDKYFNLTIVPLCTLLITTVVCFISDVYWNIQKVKPKCFHLVSPDGGNVNSNNSMFWLSWLCRNTPDPKEPFPNSLESCSVSQMHSYTHTASCSHLVTTASFLTGSCPHVEPLSSPSHQEALPLALFNRYHVRIPMSLPEVMLPPWDDLNFCVTPTQGHEG